MNRSPALEDIGKERKTWFSLPVIIGTVVFIIVVAGVATGVALGTQNESSVEAPTQAPTLPPSLSQQGLVDLCGIAGEQEFSNSNFNSNFSVCLNEDFRQSCIGGQLVNDPCPAESKCVCPDGEPVKVGCDNVENPCAPAAEVQQARFEDLCKNSVHRFDVCLSETQRLRCFDGRATVTECASDSPCECQANSPIGFSEGCLEFEGLTNFPPNDCTPFDEDFLRARLFSENFDFNFIGQLVSYSSILEGQNFKVCVDDFLEMRVSRPGRVILSFCGVDDPGEDPTCKCPIGEFFRDESLEDFDSCRESFSCNPPDPSLPSFSEHVSNTQISSVDGATLENLFRTCVDFEDPVCVNDQFSISCPSNNVLILSHNPELCAI